MSALIMLGAGGQSRIEAASRNVKIRTIACGSGDATLIQYTEKSKTYNVLIDGGYAGPYVRDNQKYGTTGTDAYLNDPENPQEWSARIRAINDNTDGYYDKVKAAFANDGTSDVIKYLRKAGLKKGATIDYVINTHPHKDHVGGLLAVAAQYKVKNFILWGTGSYGTCTYTIFRKMVNDQSEPGASLADSAKGKVHVSVPAATGKHPYNIELPDGTSVQAEEGQRVRLSVSHVHQNYKFLAFGVSYITGTGDDKKVMTCMTDEKNTFTMPAHDVNVQATFRTLTSKKSKKIAKSGRVSLRGYKFRLGKNGPVFKQLADTSMKFRNSLYHKTTNNKNNAWFNNQSLAFRMTYAGRSMITVGDLQRAGLQDLINDYGSGLSSDIYKVVHHGHVNRDGGAKGHAGSYEFIKRVDPVISLCSSGGKDPYALGEATREDLRYSDIYATQLYTDRAKERGNIVMTISPSGTITSKDKPSYKRTFDLTMDPGHDIAHTRNEKVGYIKTDKTVTLTASCGYTGKTKISWKAVDREDDTNKKTGTKAFKTKDWEKGSRVTVDESFDGVIYFRYKDSLGKTYVRKSEGITLGTGEEDKGKDKDKSKSKTKTGQASAPEVKGLKGKGVGFTAKSKKHRKKDGKIRGFSWRYSTNKDMKKARTRVTGLDKNTYSVKGLKKGKTYYVQVRYYYEDDARKKQYGDWSGIVKVKAS